MRQTIPSRAFDEILDVSQDDILQIADNLAANTEDGPAQIQDHTVGMRILHQIASRWAGKALVFRSRADL